jgi:hypothetical protein
MSTEIVPDPVSHISISGVHGRQELEQRLASAPRSTPGQHRLGSLPSLVIAGVLGAALMFLLRPVASRIKAVSQRAP